MMGYRGLVLCLGQCSRALRSSYSHRDSGSEKWFITKGVFSHEESLESLNLWIRYNLSNIVGFSFFCFPHSGNSLESLHSLEKGHFSKDPFSKRPLSLIPSHVSPVFNLGWNTFLLWRRGMGDELCKVQTMFARLWPILKQFSEKCKVLVFL